MSRRRRETNHERAPKSGGYRVRGDHSCPQETHLTDIPTFAVLPNSQAYYLRGIFNSLLTPWHTCYRFNLHNLFLDQDFLP